MLCKWYNDPKVDDNVDRLLIEYADRFQENFPTFYMRDLDEIEINRIIHQCLEDGKPFKSDYSDNSVVY